MGNRDQASTQDAVQRHREREAQSTHAPSDSGRQVDAEHRWWIRSLRSPGLSKHTLSRRPSADPAQPSPAGTRRKKEDGEQVSKTVMCSVPVPEPRASRGCKERQGESRPGPAGPRASPAWGTEGCSYRLVCGEGGVAGHEEVEPRCGDERGDEADEVVVHVAGVAQGGGAGRHDGGHLGTRVAGQGPQPGWGLPSPDSPPAGRLPVQGGPGWGHTSWLIWEKDGFWMCRRSVAIRFRAVLSSTTCGDRRRVTVTFEEKEDIES